VAMKIHIAVYKTPNGSEILEAFNNKQDAERYRVAFMFNLDNKSWWSKFRLSVMKSRPAIVVIIPCDLHKDNCTIKA